RPLKLTLMIGGATMIQQIYGLVVFLTGIGYILMGAYLLYITGLLGWEGILLVAGACIFGYLLAISGYRMSRGDRF
ncbi:MAG: hypothetical protein KAX26_09005, partial [Anaerolineae bacterium]|nr:hypothetical protein [Anaerolineae bacterium]